MINLNLSYNIVYVVKMGMTCYLLNTLSLIVWYFSSMVAIACCQRIKLVVNISASLNHYSRHQRLFSMWHKISNIFFPHFPSHLISITETLQHHPVFIMNCQVSVSQPPQHLCDAHWDGYPLLAERGVESASIDPGCG